MAHLRGQALPLFRIGCSDLFKNCKKARNVDFIWISKLHYSKYVSAQMRFLTYICGCRLSQTCGSYFVPPPLPLHGLVDARGCHWRGPSSIYGGKANKIRSSIRPAGCGLEDECFHFPPQIWVKHKGRWGNKALSCVG